VRRASVIRWVKLLASGLSRSGFRGRRAAVAGEPTPILIAYGNAMFRLGWRYERAGSASRNLPEAIRCYRKSARLGNLDAMVRLAVADGDSPPKRIIELDESD
jgi:TPR repeat protein